MKWKIPRNKKSPLFQWTAIGRPKATGLRRFRPNQGALPWRLAGGDEATTGERRRKEVGHRVGKEAGVEGHPIWGGVEEEAHQSRLPAVARVG
jgi:hypothetical protein